MLLSIGSSDFPICIHCVSLGACHLSLISRSECAWVSLSLCHTSCRPE